jgi:hypothetical protein
MAVTTLPALPKAGSPVTAAQLTAIASKVSAMVLKINSIDHLEEWRAQARAMEAYLRGRGLQRPMLGAQRRIEGRIGQLRTGCFGLEKYRLDALLAFQAETQQNVLYTIHNWQLAGGRDVKLNQLSHWVTLSVLELDQYITEQQLPAVPMDTYVNAGTARRLGYYWPASLWLSLDLWWNPW